MPFRVEFDYDRVVKYIRGVGPQSSLQLLDRFGHSLGTIRNKLVLESRLEVSKRGKEYVWKIKENT